MPMFPARVFVAAFAIVLVASCSAGRAHRQPTASASDDTLFWGRIDAISAADRQAILFTAHERLASFAPSSHVQRVKIFSQDEVRVFFAPDPDASPGDMGLERKGKRWHITDEHAP